jgi:hypothetical protein
VRAFLDSLLRWCVGWLKPVPPATHLPEPPAPIVEAVETLPAPEDTEDTEEEPAAMPLTIVDKTGEGLANGGSRSRDVRGVVLHYAVGSGPFDYKGTKHVPPGKPGELENVLYILKIFGLSYNYLIAASGTIYEVLSPDVVAWHAGGNVPTDAKNWKHGKLLKHQRPGKATQLPDGSTTAVNGTTIGIAFLHPIGFTGGSSSAADLARATHPKHGKGYTAAFTEAQKQAFAELMALLAKQYGFAPATAVWPHGNHPERAGIAPHKGDPLGFSFSDYERRLSALQGQKLIVSSTNIDPEDADVDLEEPAVLPKPTTI